MGERSPFIEEFNPFGGGGLWKRWPTGSTAPTAEHPAKVWRALTEPELIAQWLMPMDFRLEIGHRYTMTALPRPNANCSGTADWTISWTLEPEGRGTRLFLVHEGFDPDDPARMMARKLMGIGWRTHVMDALRSVAGQL